MSRFSSLRPAADRAPCAQCLCADGREAAGLELSFFAQLIFARYPDGTASWTGQAGPLWTCRRADYPSARENHAPEEPAPPPLPALPALVELSRNLGSAGSGVMGDLPSPLSSSGAGKANAEPSDVTFETTHNAQREGELNTFRAAGAPKIGGRSRRRPKHAAVGPRSPVSRKLSAESRRRSVANARRRTCSSQLPVTAASSSRT
jgi:hypothetical protein